MIASKKLTAERIAEIEKMPIVYDDDSPQLTKEELQEFVPYHRNDLPRDDSPEADLYRYLIRELSTGGVICQARATTDDGRFIKQRVVKRAPRGVVSTMESAFEDTKQYVLTELGKQFVHYTMNEVVQRINED